MDKELYHSKREVLGSTSRLFLLALKPIFTEWYAKPPRATTLICLPCCAPLACSKVRIWDKNVVIQMNLWIKSFLLLFISRHKSRIGAREERQWVSPGLESRVRGEQCWFSSKNFRRPKCSVGEFGDFAHRPGMNKLFGISNFSWT